MKKIIVYIIFVLLLAYSSIAGMITIIGGGPPKGLFPANDTNCKEWWRFENGALTTGTIGSNTLTDVNTVASDTTNFKEGAGSADFESAYFYRTDANLSAGFPLKNGDSVKVFSWVAWIKMESQVGAAIYTIICKEDTGSSAKASARLRIKENGTGNWRVNFRLGFNAGTETEELWHASNLSNATWYMVAATYNNADKSYQIMVRDTNGAVVGSDVSGTATLDANKLNVEDANFCIGAGVFQAAAQHLWDGLIDSVLIFSDVLSTQEVTNIAVGAYP